MLKINIQCFIFEALLLFKDGLKFDLNRKIIMNKNIIFETVLYRAINKVILVILILVAHYKINELLISH